MALKLRIRGTDMNVTLWDQIQEIIQQLAKMGMEKDSLLLKDAMESSSTSLEFHFKCSGILGYFLKNADIQNSPLLSDIQRLKQKIDKLIS